MNINLKKWIGVLFDTKQGLLAGMLFTLAVVGVFILLQKGDEVQPTEVGSSIVQERSRRTLANSPKHSISFNNGIFLPEWNDDIPRALRVESVDNSFRVVARNHRKGEQYALNNNITSQFVIWQETETTAFGRKYYYGNSAGRYVGNKYVLAVSNQQGLYLFYCTLNYQKQEFIECEEPELLTQYKEIPRITLSNDGAKIYLETSTEEQASVTVLNTKSLESSVVLLETPFGANAHIYESIGSNGFAYWSTQEGNDPEITLYRDGNFFVINDLPKSYLYENAHEYTFDDYGSIYVAEDMDVCFVYQVSAETGHFVGKDGKYERLSGDNCPEKFNP